MEREREPETKLEEKPEMEFRMEQDMDHNTGYDTDDMMEYEMAQLLELTKQLSEQYTSKDTSSITYETAGMLMEAVLYCIREDRYREESAEQGIQAPAEQGAPDAAAAFARGRKAVLGKVNRARGIYGMLINGFEDYGCINYRDTITRGMPGFFAKYDAKYCPQDHILTLDYPVIGGNVIKRGEHTLFGIDLIYEYLKGIWSEKQFMAHFGRQEIINLMQSLYGEYESLYLDNLCEPVLLNAAGCLIAQKPVLTLEVGRDGLCLLENYFENCTPAQIAAKLQPYILALTENTEWFLQTPALYAPFIKNALEHKSLDKIFQI